ncbi:MAG: zf-HC2 domain-containing protein [Deltaproteobacteria bacterium]|nr:MAG: zf-HC2 domain-containing protein [Deltaproteobacteria bacterium]
MFSCKQATERMSASLDGKLSLSQRIGLRLHLLMCKFCSRCWSQLNIVRDATHRCSEHPELIDFRPEKTLSQQACDRIKRLLRQNTHS